MVKKYIMICLRAFAWGFMTSIAIQGMVANATDLKELIEEIKERKNKEII